MNKDHSKESLNQLLSTMKPWSVIGLLGTVVLLFGFQANRIISEPEIIWLIAIPLMIQTYGIFIITYLVAKWIKLPRNIAAPARLIGVSNFFELAVLGVLIGVPVMLSLVFIINRIQNWFG